MSKNLLHSSIVNVNVNEAGKLSAGINIRNLQRYEKQKWGNDNWSNAGSVYHPIDKIWPGERVQYICEKYTGKSFDDAFSAYCKLVPIYQQREFLKNVDPSFSKRIYYGYNMYYIDDNGLIQRRKKDKRQKTFKVRSLDYKTERRHKVTGAKYPTCGFLPDNWRSIYKNMTAQSAQKLFDSEFEEVVIQGWKKVFDIPCKEYRRLYHDVEKQRRKRDREERKETAKKIFNFLSKREMDEKEYKSSNNLKIVRKGFDLVTSFRNDKQTNPELIAISQGF